MSNEKSDNELGDDGMDDLHNDRPQRKKKKPPKKREASYDEYISLALAALYPHGCQNLGFRRDIFSGDLLYFEHKRNQWNPVINRINTVKSYASEFNSLPVLDGDVMYSLPRFEDHLDRREAESGLRFVPDLPEWDRKDRIQIMARVLCFDERSPVQVDHAEELIKDWLCKAWKRLYEPLTRNRLLCLCGPQEIGKDRWIGTITGGAGQWVNDLPLGHSGYDQDSERSLSQGLFLKIPEFDKCTAVDASRLKDMIDKPFTSVRMAYGRRAEKRWCRSSFIASANTSDLLRDWTGATKYILFEIEKIAYELYDETPADSAQILAQAKDLANSNFKPSPESERQIRKLLSDKSPDDPSEEITELWFETVREYAAQNLTASREWESDNFIPLYRATDLLRGIAEKTGNRISFVKQKLKVAGIFRRRNNGRGYRMRLDG